LGKKFCESPPWFLVLKFLYLKMYFNFSLQDHAWIPSPSVAPVAVSAHQHHFNPFAPKSDSGFISPACNSNAHSASSEDSAENHEVPYYNFLNLSSCKRVDKGPLFWSLSLFMFFYLNILLKFVLRSASLLRPPWPPRTMKWNIVEIRTKVITRSHPRPLMTRLIDTMRSISLNF
jgi:hypothetical protein